MTGPAFKTIDDLKELTPLDQSSANHSVSLVTIEAAGVLVPQAAPKQKKQKSLIGTFLIALVVMTGLGVGGVLFLKRPAKTPQFVDLGAGILSGGGLQGHLQIRWQDSAQYQLRLEPNSEKESAEFGAMLNHSAKPLQINLRILDIAGYELCRKKITLPPEDVATGQHDKDSLTVYINDDQHLASANIEGALPCTESQYAQASYWDFNGGLPSDVDQRRPDRHLSAVSTRARSQVSQVPSMSGSGPKLVYRGDDRAMAFDSSRGVLIAQLGRSFQVNGAPDRRTVLAWVSNSANFHYQCDDQSSCVLTDSNGEVKVNALKVD